MMQCPSRSSQTAPIVLVDGPSATRVFPLRPQRSLQLSSSTCIKRFLRNDDQSGTYTLLFDHAQTCSIDLHCSSSQQLMLLQVRGQLSGGNRLDVYDLSTNSLSGQITSLSKTILMYSVGCCRLRDPRFKCKHVSERRVDVHLPVVLLQQCCCPSVSGCFFFNIQSCLPKGRRRQLPQRRQRALPSELHLHTVRVR